MAKTIVIRTGSGDRTYEDSDYRRERHSIDVNEDGITVTTTYFREVSGIFSHGLEPSQTSSDYFPIEDVIGYNVVDRTKIKGMFASEGRTRRETYIKRSFTDQFGQRRFRFVRIGDADSPEILGYSEDERGLPNINRSGVSYEPFQKSDDSPGPNGEPSENMKRLNKRLKRIYGL